jgi:rhamnose utilization protein RhaD (predicted bifunctional aldolase and dehydrogenase)/NAD(P)-dependent dehydrogenase (short-subunit alcohol dehydrogenase family)
MSLEKLTAMSHKYGVNPEYVLAGGGNTSFKDEGIMYVKSSGTQLSNIKPDEFVRMDLNKLNNMLKKDYPADDNAREEAALADMFDARLPGEEGKRPSVEAILHGLFPYKYVLHLHPPLVNGLTCVKEGEALCNQLFGNKAVWVPLIKPGYILATTCLHLLEENSKKSGEYPKIVVLQNHGIFVASDTVEEIDSIMIDVMAILDKYAGNKPDFDPVSFDEDKVSQMMPVLRMLYSNEGKAVAEFCTNKEVMNFVSDENKFSQLVKPFSPDHIVYCKDEPIFIEASEDITYIRKAFKDYNDRKGYLPKIVAIKDLGFVALGGTIKESKIAGLLFLDAIKIAVYGESFGELLPMSDELTDFILNWEIEQYRSKAAFASNSEKRLKGKIALVTGAAQGFGKGIALELVKEGAIVVIADINAQGAKECSDELNTIYGKYSTIPLQVDVTNDQSVKNMITRTTLVFGGLDLLISNAGVLVAGSIFEMTKENFQFVTDVNYTGYFLCAKYAVPIMKIQHEVSPNYLADIIEINSKSGLEGSNKNFAYAGSKFGGVGLTQSFALEFIEYGIKVNAICPGNLLDGPLWSDPEKGLFRQYLDAGKVKGATTITDVRAFYESRVPMGRGCETIDVVRAILYIVEQQYETGQAIPVTGGQVMVN